MSPPRLPKLPLRQWIARNRPVALVNLFVVSFFGGLAAYIKLADLQNAPSRKQRVQILTALFRDPFSRSQPYMGALTSLSEILLCLTATFCLATVVLLRRLGQGGSRTGRKFLLASGLLACLLLVDDIVRLTLLLETVLGLPKILMYGLYGVGILTVAYRFRRYVAEATPYPLILLALGAFFLSGIVDALPFAGHGSLILLEDAPKLIGLVNMAFYFWQVCQQNLDLALADRTGPD